MNNTGLEVTMMKKAVSLILSAVLTAGTFPCVMAAEDDNQENIVTVSVAADTFVQSGSANENTNFGSETQLLALAKDGVSSRISLLQFDLNGVVDSNYIVTKAELGITVPSKTVNDSETDEYAGEGRPTATNPNNNQAYDIYTIESGWSESDITWSTASEILDNKELLVNQTERPNVSTYVNDSIPHYTDITDGVNAVLQSGEDDILSIAVYTSYAGAQTYGLAAYSKEADVPEAFKPHIKLTLESNPNTLAAQDAAAVVQPEYDEINGKITLPDTGSLNGSLISWSSSNEAVIAADGTVTKPSWRTEEVVMTASVTNESDGSSSAISFTYQIEPTSKFDELIGDRLPGESDTYVQSGSANTNFGKDTQILALAKDGITSRIALLRFDLGSLVGDDYIAEKVELGLTVPSTTVNDDEDTEYTGSGRPTAKSPNNNQAYDIYIIDNSWTEDEITWNSSTELLENKTLLASQTERAVVKTYVNEAVSQYTDITEGVIDSIRNNASNKLSLALYTTYDGAQTYGLGAYSNEADVPEALKPHLKLTITNDADKVAVMKDYIAFSEDDLSVNLDRITGDFTLPKQGANGSLISWSVDNENVKIEDNVDSYKVTIPSVDADTAVKFTASFSSGEYTGAETLEFGGVIVPDTLAAADAAALEAPVYEDGITTQLSLPSVIGENNSDVVWLSSNETVIANDGTIVHPAFEAVTVTLTAKISNSTDGSSIVKTFEYEISGVMPYAVEGVTLKDKDGAETGTVTAGGAISNVKISKQSNTDNGIVVLAAYRNGELLGIEVNNIADETAVDGIYTINTNIAIPEDTEGFSYKVFVWEAFNSMIPYAN
ncbi:MAG: immunoglobulin-like domain-containing protein [Candidatus Ornithomonoglobus sp.]